MNLDMLDASETIQRTSESARVVGVDFYSVITRGSQFKVESIMFRIAKPENFMLITPSREQVGLQRAAECLPLILEPVTEFFNGPLLVLDFQSLYPSVMIAYNYWYMSLTYFTNLLILLFSFSTCLGRVRADPSEPHQFGVADLDIPPESLKELKDSINGMYRERDVYKEKLMRFHDSIAQWCHVCKVHRAQELVGTHVARYPGYARHGEIGHEGVQG